MNIYLLKSQHLFPVEGLWALSAKTNINYLRTGWFTYWHWKRWCLIKRDRENKVFTYEDFHKTYLILVLWNSSRSDTMKFQFHLLFYKIFNMCRVLIKIYSWTLCLSCVLATLGFESVLYRYFSSFLIYVKHIEILLL